MASDKQTLIIRDVPKKVVEVLDKIVKQDNYSSRNQMLVDMLTVYAESWSRVFYNALPPIVKQLCVEEIDSYKKEMSDTTALAARNISLAAVQLLKVIEWFEEYIMSDLGAQADEKLSGLVGLLDSSETEENGNSKPETS